MQQITIPQRDKGYNIALTIQYANGVAVNTTGYTTNIKSWSPTIPGTLLVNNTCTVVNHSEGTWVYTIALSDFNTAGTYYGELELLKSGVIESTESFKIIVAESG